MSRPLIVKQVSSSALRSEKGKHSYKNLFIDCDTVMINDIRTNESINRLIEFLNTIQGYLRNIGKVKQLKYRSYYINYINRATKVSYKIIKYNKTNLFFFSIRKLSELDSFITSEYIGKISQFSVIKSETQPVAYECKLSDDYINATGVYNILHKNWMIKNLYSPLVHIVACYLIP